MDNSYQEIELEIDRELWMKIEKIAEIQGIPVERYILNVIQKYLSAQTNCRKVHFSEKRGRKDT